MGDSKGVPNRGDVIVNADFKKSYVVAPDGSHRRLDGEDHFAAVQRVRQELADIPKRRAEAQRLADTINQQAALRVQEQHNRRIEAMIIRETARLRQRPWAQRAHERVLCWRKWVLTRWNRQWRFRVTINT